MTTPKVAIVHQDSRVMQSMPAKVWFPLISPINKIEHHIHSKTDDVVSYSIRVEAPLVHCHGIFIVT